MLIIKYINYNVECISTKVVPVRSGCGSDPILLRDLIRELGEAFEVEPEVIQVPMLGKGITYGLPPGALHHRHELTAFLIEASGPFSSALIFLVRFGSSQNERTKAGE